MRDLARKRLQMVQQRTLNAPKAADVVCQPVTDESKSIPPLGKHFAIGMATIGHWKKDGTMAHEWLLRDNQDFMLQIGLGK